MRRGTGIRRRSAIVGAGVLGALLLAAPAWACGGLIAPNGAIGLVKTSTLAGYHDGIEHYVTQFEFAGAKGEFGSIVPLPDVPTKIRKAGAWTLERLALEVQPPIPAPLGLVALEAAAPDRAVVLQTKQVGALDITVLKGGGDAVGNWARANGFDLTPDAPEVLDFYAERSPIFMAAKFDATEAARRGLETGQGISIHLSIPTDDPWVPLRILALGQSDAAAVKADVFLLTPREPALLPGPAGSGAPVEGDGLNLIRSEEASPVLLTDLAGDRGMHWLPTDGMWLTYLTLNEEARDLTYDLAIDVTGAGNPSPVDAGLPFPVPTSGPQWPALILIGAMGMIAAAVAARREPRPTGR